VLDHDEIAALGLFGGVGIEVHRKSLNSAAKNARTQREVGLCGAGSVEIASGASGLGSSWVIE